MRRATAVRRLRTIAERCQQVCSLWEVGSGLVAVHAFGPVLDVGEEEEPSIEVIQIALVVNEPPDEVTWCVRPARYTGLPYVLDLEKAPVDWYFRPAAQPVGNHRIVRPLAIWSREGGVLDRALSALAERDAAALDRLREPGVRPAALQRQVADDLAASGRHLARVRDAYWSRRWRQAHHAAGVYPENYLWDAVNGLLDLQAALDGAPEPSSPGRAADPGPDARSVPGRGTTGRRPAAEVGEPLPLDLDADTAGVEAKGSGAEPAGAEPAGAEPAGRRSRAPRSAGPRSRVPASEGPPSQAAKSAAARSGGSDVAEAAGTAAGRAAGSGARTGGVRASGTASAARKGTPRKPARRASAPTTATEADRPR